MLTSFYIIIQNQIEKSVTLAIIDDTWKEHLREMDDLKQSVQNAVYEQKDPLLIYKFESFNLFKSLIENVSKDIVCFLLKSGLPSQANAMQEDNTKRQNAKHGCSITYFKEFHPSIWVPYSI